MVSGGGSGGHFFPALAIIEEMRKRRGEELQVLYVGKKGGIDEGLCKERGIPFKGLHLEGWPRKASWKGLLVLGKFALAIFQSLIWMMSFRPSLLIGTGGYISVPIIWMAALLGRPSLIIEPNSVMGFANRLCTPLAKAVAVAYPSASASLNSHKAHLTGVPLRQLPDKQEPREARKALGLLEDRFTLFLLGGSQGAHTLNMTMIEAFPFLDKNFFQIIFMTGQDDYGQVREALGRVGWKAVVKPFFEDIFSAYSATDLVISRAGALTLAEVTAFGLPAILIPYPYATDNHQELNARFLVDHEAAIMLLEKNLTGSTLAQLIKELAQESARLLEMAKRSKFLAPLEASKKVVDIAFQMI